MRRTNYEASDLFDLMVEKIKETALETGRSVPQAFSLWFAKLYYADLELPNIFVADGPYDGKVDAFFTTHDGHQVKNHVINAKFTEKFGQKAPVSFYQEVSFFWNAFKNQNQREEYLQKVKAEFRPKYRKLFEAYDRGLTELLFVTNHTRDEQYAKQIEHMGVTLLHLDDLIQHLVDDLDGAMPRTKPLVLYAVKQVLRADTEESQVATSIVFARLYDFIRHMQSDPYDLLFARNVRLDLGNTPPNRDLKDTFAESPLEFAYSNNGITVLCEGQSHDGKTLTLTNPRVVNGSQTLHSIRDVPNPSREARVMVRIIEPPRITTDDTARAVAIKKDIINKIAIRTNKQNPIAATDLVANDDFQMELYRFFRRRRMFYERRRKEWKTRARDLKNRGIRQGPDLRFALQLVASYNWRNGKLGPVNAKSPNEIVEEDRYRIVRQASPELVYQLFLISQIIRATKVSQQKRFAKYKNYAFTALFALVIRSLQEIGGSIGHSAQSARLESVLSADPKLQAPWVRLIRAAYEAIDKHFGVISKQHKKKTGDILTPGNFFKNQSYVDPILKGRLTATFSSAARQSFETIGTAHN